MAVENPVEKVFRQELLRDKILDYVILDGTGWNGTSTENIRSCRLVNKDWLHSTSRCLRKSDKPLVELRIGHRTDSSIAEDKMKLDNFVSTFTGASHLALEQQVPPFKLSPYCQFFRVQKNNKMLLEFLNHCGSSLIELKATIQMESSYMISLSKLSLPNLRSFTVRYFRGLSTDTLNEVHQAKDIHFMQQVLNGCTQLQDLDIEFPDKVCVERLVLPTTIRTLQLTAFRSRLAKQSLELLMRNKLPNLKKLYLGWTLNNASDELIFKILEKFQATLTRFSVGGCSWIGSPREITYFELPVLKNLEEFECVSRCLGVKLPLKSNGSLLESRLPKLRNLALKGQPEEVFRKWTENSQLPTVTCLQVSIVDPWRRADRVYYTSFRSDMMQRVNMTFPNLTSLEITVCGTELCGLKYVFENLKQLQFLAVNVKQTGDIMNSDYWDAFLIGIPIELATVLTVTSYWSKVNFEDDNSIPSIKNLTELKELVLETAARDGSAPLISDAVFRLAFHQMAKLTKLTLSERFRASPQAKSEWKAKGHKIRDSRWFSY